MTEPRDMDLRGPAIERGLDPGARRLHGQHFTAADVADLISASCIRSPSDAVLDPSCGTGGFLLRARARLRHLGGIAAAGGPRLLGVELEPALAAAARTNLPEARILTADFLSVDPRSLKSRSAPLAVDAVVGNPPYVRQERLTRSRKAALRKRFDGAPAFSPRSDLHLYFWPRAMALLKQGGRLGLLASNPWLDAAYGEPLRRWLSEHHWVVAVIESECESWFDDARVRTAITIIERTPPRNRPPTRFVRLRFRLGQIAPSILPESERLARFDGLARDVEAGRPALGGIQNRSSSTQALRIRSVSASELPRRRWGALLRAPDLYFEILSRAGGGLVPLAEVATVRWGIKTGDDRFFFIRCDEPPPFEPGFLTPAVFNLMELDRLVVTRDQLRRRLLLVDGRRDSLDGDSSPRLARYIRQAERDRATHLRPTCAAREKQGTDPRRWFELRPGPPGEILWSIMHQYRHLAPLNPEGFPANDNLLLIDARPGVDTRVLAALLNSHLQALIKQAHGRHRNEGMLKTQCADVRMMPVADPWRVTGKNRQRLMIPFEEISRRRVGKIAEECARIDRRLLDLAVLTCLGYSDAQAEDVTRRLYETLEESARSERRWEQDAVSRRRLTRPVCGPG